MFHPIRSRIGQIVYQIHVKRSPFVKQLNKELKRLLSEIQHRCEVINPANTILTTDNPPLPLEQSYPEVAKHFELIANGKHPTIKAVMIDTTGTTCYLHSAKVHYTKHAKRN